MQFNYQINRSITENEGKSNFSLQRDCQSDKKNLNQQITLFIHALIDNLDETNVTAQIRNIQLIKKNDDLSIHFNLADEKKVYHFSEMNESAKESALQIVNLIKEYELFNPIQSQSINALSYASSKQEMQASKNFLFAAIIRVFRQIFIHYTVIDPIASSAINQLLSVKKTKDELREAYIHKSELIESIKQSIIAHPSYDKRLFTDEMLRSIITDIIINKINVSLKKMNEKSLNDKEIRLLNHFSLVNDLISYPESVELLEKLYKINPLEMPLKELSEIPVNQGNEAILLEVWKNLLGGVFYKVRLDHLEHERNLAEIIIQNQFAHLYLDILHFMPAKIKKELDPDIIRFEQMQPKLAIEYQLIRTALSPLDNSSHANSAVELRKEIYRNKIYPKIEKFIKSKVDNSSDALEIANLLTANTQSLELLASLRFNIFIKLNNEEMLHFKNKDIEFAVYQELERTAVLKYGLKTIQIDNLRQVRQAASDLEKLDSSLNLTKSEIKLEKKRLTALIRRPVDDILFDDKTIDALKNSDSAGIFSNAELVLLVSFSKLFSLIDFESDQEIAFEDRKAMAELLHQVEQDPLLMKKIKPFLAKNDESLETILESLPAFSRPLIAKILGKSPSAAEASLKLPFGISKKSMEFLNDYSNNLKKFAQDSQVLGQINKKTKELLKANERESDLASVNAKMKKLNTSIAKFSLQAEKKAKDLDQISHRLEKLNNAIEAFEEQKKEEISSDLSEQLEELDKVINILEDQIDEEFLNPIRLLMNELKQVVEEMPEHDDKHTELMNAKMEELQNVIKQVAGQDEINSDQMNTAAKILKIMLAGQSEWQKDSSILGRMKAKTQELIDLVEEEADQESDKIAWDPINAKLGELVQENKSLNSHSNQLQKHLTMREVGILSSYDRKVSFADKLKKIALPGDNQPVKKFIDAAEESEDNFLDLQIKIQSEIRNYYQNGSVLAYAAEKKARWLGKPLSTEEKLTAFLANGLTHGAKLYSDDKGAIQISHVVGEVDKDELSLYQLCISDTWELDVIPLISSNMKKILHEVEGENWKDKIRSSYQGIEKELHEMAESNLGKVENHQERRFKAGLADYSFLFRLLGKKEIMSHTTEHPLDFDKLHGQFFEGNAKNKEQICSEFASKSTLVCMMQLNRNLTEKILKKRPELSGMAIIEELNLKNVELPDSVMKYLEGKRLHGKEAGETKTAERQLTKILRKSGYDPKDIELIVRLGNREVFDLPYRKTERLEAIHPGRMVKLLTDKKCAVRKEPPPILRQFIDLDK